MNALAGKVSAEQATLWRLARQCGIKPAFTTVLGERQRTSPDALMAALRSYGVSVASIGDAQGELRRVIRERWRTVLEPVTVIWRQSEPGRVVPAAAGARMRLPAAHADATSHCAIELEDGSHRAFSVELADEPSLAAGESEGERFVVKRLALPDDLPVGYHRLNVECAGLRAISHLFVAPPQAYQAPAGDGPRLGVFLPLYALQSQRSWGVGDLSDLRALAQWVQDIGGTTVSTLPLLAANLESNLVSPYSPLSRLFFNELYLDVAQAPEFAQCEAARRLAESREFQVEVSELQAAPYVEYQRAMSLKRRVLELLADHFFATSSHRRAAFDRATKGDEKLHSYAAFRATAEREGANWQNWPQRQRDGRLEPGDYDERAYRYHLYVQWLLREQLADVAAVRSPVESGTDGGVSGGGLYLDLPVGVPPEGYDVWRYRDDFVTGTSVGAPPDDFFTAGQDWGLMPVHPQRPRHNGHVYFRLSVRNHLRTAGPGGALRIDHIMALHRLYWVPPGFSPRDGVYVRYPAEEMYAILCIESQRNQASVIGENLGTVPPSVNMAMNRHGIAGMYVAQFSWTGNSRRPLKPPPRGTVASLNTHDVPTFAAFWDGDDIDQRRDMGLLDAVEAKAEHAQRAGLRRSILRGDSMATNPDIRRAMLTLLELLADSDAGLLLVNLEDLWLERRPQNIPGVQLDTNWRRKASYSLERMCNAPEVIDVLQHLSNRRRGSQ